MQRRWIKFIFERNTYVVELSHISSFTIAENGRIFFYLPDGKVKIVIHPQTNPEAYQQILEYIENTTGQSLL